MNGCTARRPPAPRPISSSAARGVVEMGVRPFAVFASSRPHGQAERAADASALRRDGVAGHGFLRPVASAAIRFRDAGPQVEGRQIHVGARGRLDARGLIIGYAPSSV